MDRNISLILLVVALFFFPMLLLGKCQKKKGQKYEKVYYSDYHDPKHKTFVMEEAKPELICINTGKKGKPGFYAEFNTIGGGLKRLLLSYSKEFVKTPGADPNIMENWVPVIDHRIYKAIDRNGVDQGAYVFSFVLEDPNSKLNIYRREGEQLVPSGPNEVPWKYEKFKRNKSTVIKFKLALSNGLVLFKEFVFPEGKQHFILNVGIENKEFDLKGSTENWNFILTGPSVVPSEKFIQGPSYTIQDFYGYPRAIAVKGIRNNRDEDEVNLAYADGKPNASPNGVVLAAYEGRKDELIKFAGAYHKFFACLISPINRNAQDALIDVTAVKHPIVGPGEEHFFRLVEPWSHILPRLGIQFRIPEKGKKRVLTFQVYAGPKDVELFNKVPEYNDYYHVYEADLKRQQCFCSVGFVGDIGKLLLSILRFFHSISGNWGLAIIMLTILVRIILVPLNFKSQFEMAKYQKKMAKIKPIMDAIKKKYEKNKKRMNQELIKLQREHKLTPPLMGCLPMFITIPVFIGLFTALRVAYDLRHQPFILWIKDLSMPDMLLRLQEGSKGIIDMIIPDYLNVLPILMTLLWWFQQKLMPKSDDPQQKQMQTMMQIMPIVFGFMLYNYAAGLALYMTVSSIFGIIESKLIKKKVQALASGN